MISIMKYQLLVAACLAICYAPYYLFWRKSMLLTNRRGYLLFTVIFSFSAPLLNLDMGWLTSNEITTYGFLKGLSADIIPVTDAQTKENILNSASILTTIGIVAFYLWALGAISLITSFTSTLIKGFALRDKATRTANHNGFKVYIIPGQNQCFTFFTSIYISADLYNSPNRALLLSHEEAHISSFHYIDLVLAQLAKTMQWFNPAVYLISRELKSLHEFSADRFAINQTHSKGYLTLLLEFCSKPQSPGLMFNQFSYGCIKKRIVMITNSAQTNKTSQYIRHLATLPFLAVALLLVSCTERPEMIETKQEVVEDAKIITYAGSKSSNDDALLKEFRFQNLNNQFSVILRKGIVYRFISLNTVGSYNLEFSKSKSSDVKSFNVSESTPLSYIFSVTETGAYTLKITSHSDNTLNPELALLLVDFIE